MTAETLQYHTVPQSLQDNKRFAQTVKFGFDNCGGANVDKSPWVLIGGSYAGALAAWQSVITPGVFAAHHASSAVIHVIEDFWQFWTPIEQVMPRNCSEGVKLVIKKVDSILSKGERQEIAAMKKEFGVALLNDVDFASTLTKMLPNSFSYVSEFCNNMEKRVNKRTLKKGLNEADVALDGWDAPFEKVMFVDGEFDMWNSATMSSAYRPGGPWNSTEEVPRMVVARGGYIPDLDLIYVNADVVEALAVVTKK
ncbi:putative extracellular serine carboxypeptidase [Colletotrichum sp. SAR 10_96]|nr:putative extracellular serine carboxypeptidase [Colletotrichum sp. SAR 10_96]